MQEAAIKCRSTIEDLRRLHAQVKPCDLKSMMITLGYSWELAMTGHWKFTHKNLPKEKPIVVNTNHGSRVHFKAVVHCIRSIELLTQTYNVDDSAKSDKQELLMALELTPIQVRDYSFYAKWGPIAKRHQIDCYDFSHNEMLETSMSI